MSTGARVESLDALKTFRVALFKFAETASVALGDVESDMHRTMMWLETEQLSHWQGQIRKRQEMLAKALDALRQKTLYKDATGRVQSAVDEQKIVQLCRRKLEEANQKLANVKIYSRRLQKEIENYRGTVQRFATTVQGDIPVYAAKIDRMAGTLQAYTELSVDDVSAAATAEFANERAKGAAQAAGYGEAPAGAGTALGGPAPAGEPLPPLTAAEYPGLRLRTPAEQFRLAAPPGLMPTAGWMTRILSNHQRLSLASLPAEREVPDAASRIIVRRESYNCATIYLERIEGKSEGDSGWYMGPATRVPPGAETQEATFEGPPIEAMRVSDFLAVRPDLANALSLPKGFLVVISPGAVLAVLDPHNRDVWELKEPDAKARVGDEVDPTEGDHNGGRHLL